MSAAPEFDPKQDPASSSWSPERDSAATSPTRETDSPRYVRPTPHPREDAFAVPNAQPGEKLSPTEGGILNQGDSPAPVIRFPNPRPAPYYRSQLLQQWEGTVLEICERAAEIDVRLRDLTDPRGPELSATIALDEIPSTDHPLVALGAVFYWTIGYEVKPHGQKTRASNIRFRRLPVWTAADIKKLEQEPSELDIFLEPDA